MSDSNFGFAAIDPAEAGFLPAQLVEIDQWLESYVSTSKITELSLAILRDGRLVYGRCLGPAILANSSPITPTTIHRIYSMTKPVTGVAVLQLLERGDFELDDPVADYLPEFAAPLVLSEGGSLRPAARPISIRHLLTHTAGLTYGFLESGPVDQTLLERKLDAVPGHVDANSLAEWCHAVAGLPLICDPGTRWQYSVAMDVLGRLVEVVSGRPFDEYVHDAIIEPLGMVDTGFHVPTEKHARFTACYRHTDSGTQPIERKYKPFHEPTRVPLGGGGLVSTMVDYLRFAEMLRRGGTLDDARILSRTSVELMMTNHLGHLPLDPEFRVAPLRTMPSMSTFRGDGFGLTGMVTLSPEDSGILGPPGQFSWGGAASTSFWVDRASGLSVVQLAQLLPSSTYPLRRESRNLVYGAMTDHSG